MVLFFKGTIAYVHTLTAFAKGSVLRLLVHPRPAIHLRLAVRLVVHLVAHLNEMQWKMTSEGGVSVLLVRDHAAGSRGPIHMSASI